MSSLPPYKFEAAFAPENATPKEVVWESSDTEVADIANDGTVWPHKTGITTISVKLKDRQEIRDSFALSFVNTPLESLTIKGRPKDDTIVRTYGVQLSADIYPLNASVDKIEWTSSNPEIATVDKNGYCTGVSGGTTTITAKAGNVTASFQLTVRLFYVDFAKYPYEMIIGETDTYSPVISPYEDKEVIVTSSNPEVAKVNQESKSIYACGAGTTTIRIELAEDSSYYSEYTLTVESDEYNFYKPDNDILKVGDSWKFIDDPKANISIGNQDLAEITSHGVLKALKPGDIVIEHWKGDRSGFGRYELTITPTAVTIDGRPNNNQMKVGDIHPGMSISTSNSYDESIEWSSSNENVATVDCDFLNGVRIFAHNEGVTRISAYDPEYKVTVSFILTVSAKKVENVEIRKIDPDSVDTILLTEKIRLGGYVTPVDATYDKVDWLPQSINGGQVTLMPTEGINQNRTIDVRGDHTGQVKITAYAGGMASAPYILTIIEMTVKITNKPSNNNLNVGQTHQLGKEVYPSDANISWHSSNKNVAQIDSTGKITALSSGSTTIWVEATKDGVDINDTNAFTLTVETLNIKNRPENDTLYVGQTHTVTLSSNFIVPEWHSSSRQIAKVDENGKITTQRTGKVEIYAVYNNEKYSFTLNVESLTIYQTQNTLEYGFDDSDIYSENPIFAEDLKYGDIKEEEFAHLSPYKEYPLFSLQTEQRHIENLKTAGRLFSMEPLQTVALDMIDTFIQGDTDEYRNNVLNQEVYNHESTQIYLSGVIFSLNSLINDYNGDIAALKYDTNNTRDRKEHPFVEKLEELKIFEPVYNSEWDKVNGFAFCLHGLWGNKVEVTSFIIDDIKKHIPVF